MTTTERVTWWARLRDEDPIVVVGRLTLLSVLVNARERPDTLVLAIAATALLFLRPDRMRRPWPWLLLSGGLGVIQLSEWWRPDDHVVATTFWVLALGLSRLTDDTDGVRRLAARLLVLGIFGFAVAWNLLSSQYTSGDFFRYTLVWDDRFDHVAAIAGGDEDLLDRQRRSLVEEAFSPDPASVVVSEPERGAAVAWVFSVWGIVIEATVALAHAAPLASRWRALRPVSVAVFCATTYLVLPVAGFGFLLLTLAAAGSDDRRWQPIATFGIVAVATWSGLFALLLA